MLHYICLYADAESKFVLTISAHKCEDSWNLRSQYARVCGMIINNNGKYIFTVDQDKLPVRAIHLVRHRESCLLPALPWASCIWAQRFRGFWMYSWIYINMIPTQAASAQESHFSSALGPELCHRCTCLQPWPLPALAFASPGWLTWGMTCHFPFVRWGLGCWWNLPQCSCACPLAQICWEGVPGGPVVTFSWTVDRSYLFLPCWGAPVLKLWTEIRTFLLKLVLLHTKKEQMKEKFDSFQNHSEF